MMSTDIAWKTMVNDDANASHGKTARLAHCLFLPCFSIIIIMYHCPIMVLIMSSLIDFYPSRFWRRRSRFPRRFIESMAP
jgi:hypothetical protein